MKPGNLTVIGTSHIAKDSVSTVKEAIRSEKPDIVAVELDYPRLHALLNPQRTRLSLELLKTMGLTGFIFFTIGSLLQKKLGKIMGTLPGEEMKAAVELARQNNARVALIDQPLSTTMQKISKISLKEKLRLAKDLLFGIAGLEREKASIDLSKVPPESFISTAMRKVRKRYPGLYKALVSDRDSYMASRLGAILEAEPGSKIVAVVGAGHEKEITRMVKAKISA